MLLSQVALPSFRCFGFEGKSFIERVLEDLQIRVYDATLFHRYNNYEKKVHYIVTCSLCLNVE